VRLVQTRAHTTTGRYYTNFLSDPRIAEPGRQEARIEMTEMRDETPAPGESPQQQERVPGENVKLFQIGPTWSARARELPASNVSK
jgi:hypothetical protein